MNLNGIFIVKNAIYCIVITELPHNENFNKKNFEKKYEIIHWTKIVDVKQFCCFIQQKNIEKFNINE